MITPIHKWPELRARAIANADLLEEDQFVAEDTYAPVIDFLRRLGLALHASAGRVLLEHKDILRESMGAQTHAV